METPRASRSLTSMPTPAQAPPAITGVDFCRAHRGLRASMHFYGTVLGLPFVKRWGEMPGASTRPAT